MRLQVKIECSRLIALLYVQCTLLFNIIMKKSNTKVIALQKSYCRGAKNQIYGVIRFSPSCGCQHKQQTKLK